MLWEGIHGLTARRPVNDEADTWMPPVPQDTHTDAMLDVLCAGVAQRFPPEPATTPKTTPQQRST